MKIPATQTLMMTQGYPDMLLIYFYNHAKVKNTQFPIIPQVINSCGILLFGQL